MYCVLQWAVGVLRIAMGGMLGQATRQKAHRPGLGIPPIAILNMFSFFVLVSQAFLWKEMGGLLRFAVCCMVCLVGRGTKLGLLTLYELLFSTGTFLICSPWRSNRIARKEGSFRFLSMCVVGNGVCIAVCIVPRVMLGGPMHGIAHANTPRTLFSCRHLY